MTKADSDFVIPSSFSASPARTIRASSFQLLQITEQRRMPFLIDQRFGAGLAFFHNEFVESGIDRERIFAVETGETKFVYRPAGRAHHSFDIEITAAIHAEIFPDFLHRHLVCDYFLRIGTIA